MQIPGSNTQYTPPKLPKEAIRSQIKYISWNFYFPHEKHMYKSWLLFCFILSLPLYSPVHDYNQFYRLSLWHVRNLLPNVKLPKCKSITDHFVLLNHRNINKWNKYFPSESQRSMRKKTNKQRNIDFKEQKISQNINSRIHILRKIKELHLYTD